MNDIVFCEPVRTAVGRYGGMYVDVPATDLARTVIEGVLQRTKVDTEKIDEVIFGQCYPNGEAPAIGRVAALDAGIPVTVPGLQIDRRCGSGLQAALDAARPSKRNRRAVKRLRKRRRRRMQTALI